MARRRLRDHQLHWRGGVCGLWKAGCWEPDLAFGWIEVAGSDPEYLSFASDVRINMMRFLFRLLSLFALSVAVIMAVLDATCSIAGSALIMTPLADELGRCLGGYAGECSRNDRAEAASACLGPHGRAVCTRLPGFIVFVPWRWLSCSFQSAGGRNGPPATLQWL